MESLVMKKHLPHVFIVLMLIAGLSLLLYPTVSEYINSLNLRKAITEYTNTVEGIPIENREELLAAAAKYNEYRAETATTLLRLSDEDREVYSSMLNVSGNGIMGYINIPAIKAFLPIYHGIEDTVLQIGIGHLEGSSLPVGGESSHCVLSGHTGLPSATLFTHLDSLVAGDIFTLHVLGETFTYQVDSIEIMQPNDINLLSIEKGQDICTLVTCTPYGINTHRLFVRGHRIENLPDDSNDPEAGALQAYSTTVFTLIIAGAVVLPVLLIVLLLVLRAKRRKK